MEWFSAKVGAELMALTVFMTAYDQHVVRAFEANTRALS